MRDIKEVAEELKALCDVFLTHLNTVQKRLESDPAPGKECWHRYDGDNTCIFCGCKALYRSSKDILSEQEVDETRSTYDHTHAVPQLCRSHETLRLQRDLIRKHAEDAQQEITRLHMLLAERHVSENAEGIIPTVGKAIAERAVVTSFRQGTEEWYKDLARTAVSVAERMLKLPKGHG